ncbi:IucA/IucC family protein [Ochrobactrum chromiisoli]|uniref:IucA/IucC family siderophore biosynthesis protein n=1 Tax=Ochrobactrum chromiisoli TaxID=2993941 RepID=A0ABT3QT73_9HYPH|nr:IucA/IucC family siderophore biosynthesis protein [Ochrobactrum chromiisoli]MCX2698826.1 IucA/IucC family siderophore biosynthesis protein [Ochrobactrum chromiisoli]
MNCVASVGPLPGRKEMDATIWASVNRTAIAKTISELSYEEGFSPQVMDRDETVWQLPLGDGVAYRFNAQRRIWGQLHIDAASIVRVTPQSVRAADDAVGFFVDARAVLNISPPTFCTYAKELYNTLMADAHIAASRSEYNADDLASLPDTRLQALLDGHPKAPANKGRLGWGLQDSEAYAPEFQTPIRLFWLAAARSHCQFALAGGLTEDDLLAESLNSSERDALLSRMRDAGIGLDTHMLLPVHPWQWQAMIVSQYAGEIAAGRLVPLGAFGDTYIAQQSVRTLANEKHVSANHLKLSLTILNTSAWRGVPGKYMSIGPTLSRWLAATAKSDPMLRNVRILQEVAGAFYPHPHFSAVKDAPYQFCEMLGAIWRESPEKHLPEGWRPMMMGALAQGGSDGCPVVSALIARSGLSHEQWLERLFDAVAIPLYHFLCRYGVGFIAHGQNITLLLDGDVPAGVAIKDFQGDTDLLDQEWAELMTMPDAVKSTLKRRPAIHLQQHLQTGHFASVLRFVSEALLAQDGYGELSFYSVLAARLRHYQKAHPELSERFALFDLFSPKMPRIAINRVRFAIGYGDANERPVPALGTELDNPLYLAETASFSSRRAQTKINEGVSL